MVFFIKKKKNGSGKMFIGRRVLMKKGIIYMPAPIGMWLRNDISHLHIMEKNGIVKIGRIFHSSMGLIKIDLVIFAP